VYCTRLLQTCQGHWSPSASLAPVQNSAQVATWISFHRNNMSHMSHMSPQNSISGDPLVRNSSTSTILTSEFSSQAHFACLFWHRSYVGGGHHSVALQLGKLDWNSPIRFSKLKDVGWSRAGHAFRISPFVMSISSIFCGTNYAVVSVDCHRKLNT
jgi:hypothetical protein